MSTPSAVVTRTNVLAGPAAMYIGSLDASGNVIGEPANAAVNAAPAASAWTDVGGTDGGVQVITNQSFFIMRVDQIPDPLGRRLTERDVLARTNLAEPTLERLSQLLNEPAGTVTSGSGFKAYEIQYGQAAMFPTERCILVDGWAPVDGNTARRRRLILRRVVSTENIESSYRKDGLYFFPVTFGAMFVSNTVSPVKIQDETA